MDNNPAPDSLPAADTQSSGDPNQSPLPEAPAPVGGMRVLQPTSDTLSPESPPPEPSPQPAPDRVPAAPASPTPSASPPQPPAHSIYPEATHGINADAHQPIPSAPIDTKNESGPLSFSEGYSLGGTIFWYQLIAVVVVGFIFYGITLSVSKTANISLAVVVGMLHYVLEYLILIYIPYSILKSNAIEEPFWRSLFGAAVQSVIDAATLFIASVAVVYLFAHAITVGVITSTSGHTGTAGAGFTAADLIFLVVALLIAYFFTKLSWGVAFWLIGIIKNKIIIRAIGLIIIGITLAGIVRHYIALYDAYHLIDTYKAQQIHTLQQRINSAKVPN
jgi:hypothetical protein